MHARTEVWDVLPQLSGVPSPARLRRLILALEVYIDDSGKDDPPVFVLAGFVAESENWAAFTDEWNEELARYPAIDYFKMKEANSLTEQFEGVSSLARDHKVSRLAALCEKHLAIELACVVPHADYAAEFESQYAPRMDDPYILTMMGIYVLAFKWLAEIGRTGERINFIFDRQLEKEAIIRELFAEFANMPGSEAEPIGLPPTPNFEDDKTTPALQAADLSAWHVRRAFADRESKNSTLTAATDFIGKPERLRLEVWNADRLRTVLTKLGEHSNSKGKLTPYQALWTAKYFDFYASHTNNDILEEASKEDSDEPIDLVTILSPQTKRFLLVHSCPNSHNPHLHRRASGACLAED